ncbi:helix-turn-helix domain containing protein [Paenibacillus sp. BSR1-1]|uniref:TetR/AcrR family transcriptional regulator n=1 Tax=Bacillales TaxID=1385 RepID=UPI0025B03BC4|nr:TetR/AcrR family transcriptional regulator [Paenibacillus sp. BSR1-1]MDN3017140.1 helix-turn-helix domain containing protein [Paenibacillus sp. BSR1-1]
MGTQLETKDKIIQNAREIFAERGYNGATTAEIARRVGVSEAALYKHFKGKKDIFLACITPALYNSTVNHSDHTPEQVREIVKERVELVRRNLDSFNILFREAPNHPELAKMFLNQVYTNDQNMKHLLKTLSNKELSPVQTLLYELGITTAIWSILNFEKMQADLISEKIPAENLEEEIANVILYGILGNK